MKELIGKLAGESRPWGTIVWAGVGHGSHLPSLRQFRCTRRLLLEPHPVLHARLQARSNAFPGDELRPLALWEDAGTRPFNLVSNPVLSSLLPVDGLLARLPNLSRAGVANVDTCDLDGLIAECGLSGDDNLLVLEIAGAEAAVLARASRTALGAFAAIIVRGADAAGDYAGAGDLAETAAAVAATGFRVEPGDGCVLLRRDEVLWPLRSRILELETEVVALRAQAATLSQERTGWEARLADFDQQLQLSEQLLEQVAAAQAEVARHEALAAERQRSLDEALRDRDAARVRMAELESAVTDAEARAAESDRRLQEVSAEARSHADALAARTASLEGAVADVGTRDARIGDLERQAVTQAEEIAAQAGEMEAMRKRIAELEQLARDQDTYRAALTAQAEAWMAERDQHAGRVVELQKAMTAQEAELAERQAKLDDSRQEAAAQQQQVQALAERAEFLAVHAADIGRHRDALFEESAERLAQLEQATQALAAAQARQAELEGRVAAQAEKVRKLSDGLEEATRNAALGTRLHALKDADLRELQQRYEASLAVQERQHGMLLKLGERLGMASRYFHQLAMPATPRADRLPAAKPVAKPRSKAPARGPAAKPAPEATTRRSTKKAAKASSRAAKAADAPGRADTARRPRSRRTT